jgi:phage tail sheath protein FI
VEVIEIDDGTRPIQTVRSATIGLVGTAPKGPVNTPTLILGSRSEAVKIFGESMPGFTIPDALDAIFDQVGAMVVVINVADPEQHNTSINAPELKFDTDGKIELGYQNISNLTLKRASDSKIYELGKDYLLDQVKGIITRTNSIENTTKVTASYKCLDLRTYLNPEFCCRF